MSQLEREKSDLVGRFTDRLADAQKQVAERDRALKEQSERAQKNDLFARYTQQQQIVDDENTPSSMRKRRKEQLDEWLGKAPTQRTHQHSKPTENSTSAIETESLEDASDDFDVIINPNSLCRLLYRRCIESIG